MGAGPRYSRPTLPNSSQRLSYRTMPRWRSLLVLSLSLCVLLFCVCECSLIKCKDDELVVYSLVFETSWTRQQFPKHYPKWRQPAHWSKLIGISHNEEFHLFRTGETANKDFKEFAETGKTDFFEKRENKTGNHICDEFYSPSVKSGVGRTEVNFFVDGNHSLVTAAVRLVPSPDWFVGLDSLDLCGEGRWTDSIIVEASPMDAGTDNGLTFTSPNWPSDPPEAIYKITSRYPRHPAGSFFYPGLQDLPVIAKFLILKKQIYKQEVPSSTIGSPPKVKKVHRKTRRTGHTKCKVTSWSGWSACTANCGHGVSYRTRKVKHHPKSKTSCPPLREETPCTGKECSNNLFNWE